MLSGSEMVCADRRRILLSAEEEHLINGNHMERFAG